MEPKSTYPQDEPNMPVPEPTVPEQFAQSPQQPLVTVTEATPDVEPASTPVTPPVQPLSDFPTTAATPPTAPQKNSKKKFIIGGIVAAILVLTGAGSALAYNMWYQNPDKVLVDSVMNLMKAKSIVADGAMTMKSKEFDLNIALDAKSTDQNGHMGAKVSVDLKEQNIKLDVGGEATYIDNDIYLKVNDLEKVYNQVADAYIDTLANAYATEITPDMRTSARTSMDEQFMPIVKKIDNKWIKISEEDLKDTSKEADKTKECVTAVFKKLQDDDSMSNEVTKIYRDNKFVIVKEKLGNKDGSLGYVIDVNEDAAKNFAKEFSETTLAKELTKCDDSIKFDPEDISDSDDKDQTTRAEVWIDRWSHQLTRLSLETDSRGDNPSKATLNINTKVNAETSIEVPKDFVTLKQLQDDLNNTFLSSMSI